MLGSVLYGPSRRGSEFAAAVSLLPRYQPDLAPLQTHQYPLRAIHTSLPDRPGQDDRRNQSNSPRGVNGAPNRAARPLFPVDTSFPSVARLEAGGVAACPVTASSIQMATCSNPSPCGPRYLEERFHGMAPRLVADSQGRLRTLLRRPHAALHPPQPEPRPLPAAQGRQRRSRPPRRHGRRGHGRLRDVPHRGPPLRRRPRPRGRLRSLPRLQRLALRLRQNRPQTAHYRRRRAPGRRLRGNERDPPRRRRARRKRRNVAAQPRRRTQTSTSPTSIPCGRCSKSSAFPCACTKAPPRTCPNRASTATTTSSSATSSRTPTSSRWVCSTSSAAASSSAIPTCASPPSIRGAAGSHTGSSASTTTSNTGATPAPPCP